MQIDCKKTIRKHLPQDPPRFLAKKKVAKYEFFNVESKHFPKNGGGIGDGRNVEKTDRRHLPQDPPFFYKLQILVLEIRQYGIFGKEDSGVSRGGEGRPHIIQGSGTLWPWGPDPLGLNGLAQDPIFDWPFGLEWLRLVRQNINGSLGSSGCAPCPTVNLFLVAL